MGVEEREGWWDKGVWREGIRPPQPLVLPELHMEWVEATHICNLPVYWAPIVAVGTVFICPECKRIWFMDREMKWESDEGK